MAPVRPGMAPRWPFPGDAASGSDGHDDDFVTAPEELPMTPSPFDAMPVTRPEAIAPETFLIPNLAPGPDGLLLPVNSMVIRGREPVIVDTGAPVHREQWLEKVFAVVEPDDVRWIFLRTTTATTPAGCSTRSSAARNATLVTNFFSVERLALEKPALPLERMRWVEPGGSFDAGDRVLRLFRPPVFDGPTSRGLFDPKTRSDVDRRHLCLLDAGLARCGRPAGGAAGAGMPAMNSAVSPWHAWLDRGRLSAPCRRRRGPGAHTVASAHGPVLRGDRLDDAFDRLRGLAGAPTSRRRVRNCSTASWSRRWPRRPSRSP